MAWFRLGVALLMLWLVLAVGRADGLAVPGLQRDANAYLSQLTHRFPAGGTSAGRAAAEAQARDAAAAGKWNEAAAALEQRVGMGQATEAMLRDLATALLRRTPPDAPHAAAAALLASGRTDQPPVEDLQLLAQALHAMNRPVAEISVLQKLVELSPGDTATAARLAEVSRAAGVLVTRVTTEAQADPPRACFAFTVPPSRAPDFQPADWVRLEPPVPDAAVTHEGDLICISGLPSGRTTTVVLRAGLPGTQGLAMKAEDRTPIAMPNRDPSIGFDTRLFVLPRGQAPAIAMSTVNLSAVSLRLVRLTERNVAMLLRQTRLGMPVEYYQMDNLASEVASEVWKGKADIPGYQLNKTVRTKLPLPDALTTAGPGLYALIVATGDGNPRSSAQAVQLVLRTDLAPTVWRGTDGLTVQIRDYGTALPRPGVRLHLLSRGNDILAEAVTDEAGVAKFAAPLLHGDGPSEAASLQAFADVPGGQDFATLDLNAAAFDLSDRGVDGMPQPGPYDAYVWPDRGIYRPGETVQLMALLRDNAGSPADIPAQLTVRRPNGQVFLQTVPPRGGDASINLPIKLTPSAPAGVWTVELRADPAGQPIGTASFRVDAFVPEKLAVDVGPAPAALVVGQPADIPVTARFLYGAPGGGLSGHATMRMVIDPAPFPALAGSRIGIEGEAFAPDQVGIDLPETDAQGHTVLPVRLASAPDTTQALKAQFDIAVNDVAGRASRASLTVPVRPAGPLIGIRPLFKDDSIDAGTEAKFEIAAVDPMGARIAMNAKLRLVRERPDWRVVMRGALARYETVYHDEPLETRTIAIAADAPLTVVEKLPFGRYRLEVSQAGGLAVTTMRFRSGWASSDNPDVPDRVDVSSDRKMVPAGQMARVHIAAPFAGHATVLVLSDRVHALENIDLPTGVTDIDVPVKAEWGPGAYVTVHAFRAGDGKDRPGRAIGLTWIGVDPAARTLPLSIEAPAEIGPRAAHQVVLHAPPGAWVSLAAVDEGVLQLTRYVSPDAGPHFLGRRALGLDIRDDWGRLIPPADGGATLLRQGGDDGGFALPEIPQRTVSLFAPPRQVGADGRAVITLDMPDFAGSVRLMAVGWQGAKLGAASQDLLVRDPLIAEALLPRFLAPGDSARLSVLLQNIALPAGEDAVDITVDGPLALSGPAHLSATLAQGARAVPATVLTATGAGTGGIHLAITGPGGFALRRDSVITVRPSRAAQTLVSAGDIAPGATLTLSPKLDLFLPGTVTARASFGAPVRYDVAAMQQALDDYPLSCLEQATSRGLPLAMLPPDPSRAARLQQAVSLVLDRQRFDGGFGLWSGNDAAEPWLSSYAMDFLIRARAAGAAVPEVALREGLKFLAEAADSDATEPADMVTQAYRLYVLAVAGQGRPGAARVLMQSLERIPTPLARAQLGAALALAHDRPRAEAAFGAALLAPERRWWSVDDGSALRDQLAIVVLLRESGLLPQRLQELVARLPGADLSPDALNTQELAWAAAAPAALSNRAAAVSITLDGRSLTGRAATGLQVALTGPATVRNMATAPLWHALSVTGVPVQPPPAGRQGMRVTRQFLNLDGSPLDLDHLTQNTVFILQLDGRVDDGQAHSALLQQGLPAGWEIAGRISTPDDGKSVPGMPWLEGLSATDAQPAADDRFAAIVTTDTDHTAWRVAVRVRAVTPGSYTLPGASFTDLYRPAIFARQAEGRITVLPAP
jgi:uncharacterized protein YfaS (alpha-2-macroglobulin family)